MRTCPSSPAGGRAGAVVPRHVVLVGLSGSGKSTVGAIVAARLKAPFADIDALVEHRAGRSITRIFDEDGEAAFRALEAAVAADVLAGPPSIIAAGGGTFDDPGNRRRTLEAAVVVYLETSPGVAAARLDDSVGRPLLDGSDRADRLGAMLERRAPAYHQAQQRVTTDGLTADRVADEVVALARQKGGW